MVEISGKLKKFLQENKELLAEGKIPGLYGELHDQGITGEFTDLLLDSGVNIWEYFGRGRPNFAFANSIVKNILIPDNVTSIGGYAFARCSNLTNINIPDGVTKVSNGTFSGCDSLTSITIPNSVTDIGYVAFHNCSSLTSVTIGNSVANIGGSAFNGCSSLTSIVIPDSVTDIGAYAFSGCKSLVNVIIPSSVTNIRYGVFFDCNSLTNITYKGTREQWEKVDKHRAWDAGAKIEFINCTDGEIELQ